MTAGGGDCRYVIVARVVPPGVATAANTTVLAKYASAFGALAHTGVGWMDRVASGWGGGVGVPSMEGAAFVAGAEAGREPTWKGAVLEAGRFVMVASSGHSSLANAKSVTREH